MPGKEVAIKQFRGYFFRISVKMNVLEVLFAAFGSMEAGNNGRRQKLFSARRFAFRGRFSKKSP
ncbi:hypothetical protein EFA69_10885 [Rufibacter immobilis]|uniref:Uncharacterized protein n=1 Tax=Rufibacter immobilis TaxID=1348778 RepID=A0A3M9MWX1_9BACT|nr:hypothetical protein EFA69_10885 [Rufibacter immobilis]